MPAGTILGRFQERVRGNPEKVALRYKSGGEWQEITWQAYGDYVRRVAKGFTAVGVGRGDKIAILSRNRPTWHFADLACMSLGAITTPVYATNSPEQVAYIVGHSDSKIICVENPEQLDKVLKMRSELPQLRKAVVFDDYAGDADSGFVMSFEKLLDAGEAVPDSTYDDALAAVSPEDVATFVYTSGTTGPPKAVMLTHDNVWWTATHVENHVPIGNADRARCISYLPLSHIAERMISHFLQIHNGTETWFADSLETLREDMADCKPTYFFGVPRVWEKFYAAVEQARAGMDPNSVQAKLGRKAVAIGREVAELEQEAVQKGGTMADARIPLGLKIRHLLFDKVVLHKIRSRMNLDHCVLAVSAAAPLTPELIWFFHSIGIKIAEGYGQSEDNGPTTWNPPGAVLIGSVGTAIPGMEVKVAHDGEVLARGGNVMAGYYKDEKVTRETVDSDGWLHSGDIGEFNEHGYLKITDRKKDLIITAGGKNVAPQEIENRLKVSGLISQAVVIGDRRPFLTALVTLDEEKAPLFANEHGIEGGMAEIARHERTIKQVQGSIDELNASLAKVESVKKFRILERDFLQEENEITPTLKVKRKTIAEVYAQVIEEMYSKESPGSGSAAAPEHK